MVPRKPIEPPLPPLPPLEDDNAPSPTPAPNRPPGI
jgi:hypothetical protein